MEGNSDSPTNAEGSSQLQATKMKSSGNNPPPYWTCAVGVNTRTSDGPPPYWMFAPLQTAQIGERQPGATEHEYARQRGILIVLIVLSVILVNPFALISAVAGIVCVCAYKNKVCDVCLGMWQSVKCRFIILSLDLLFLLANRGPQSCM